MPRKKAAKKKVAKRKPAKPPARRVRVPEELAYLWDEETKGAWKNISETYRRFFIEWIRQGYNGTKAYKTLHPNANYNTCRKTACVILKKPAIVRIRKQIVAVPHWELELARNTFVEAMEKGSLYQKMAGAKNHINAYEKAKAKEPPPAPEGEGAAATTEVQDNINVLVTKEMKNIQHLLNDKYKED